MGPFDEDLKGATYEMLMMEDTYGWIEVDGIPDKSSVSTTVTERYKKGVRDIVRYALLTQRRVISMWPGFIQIVG